MKQKPSKPLIPPLSGRWASVGLAMLLAATTAASTQAQTDEGGTAQLSANQNSELPANLNSELRTRTWSFYGEGGLSWATDVWYPNVDAKKSYRLAPAAGGGIDLNIRPWIRVGVEYLWTRYRREQRFAALDTKTAPVKAYGNYLMNVHSAKLGAQLNLMELWPRRKAQWFNIYVGTGAGYMMGWGNEYAITFANTITQNGKTTVFTPGQTVTNDGQATVTGQVTTTNRHESFRKVFIPATLHVEADLTRRVTLGLKGEMDWLLSRNDIAPKNLVYALATLRYNLVRSRAQVERAYYENRIDGLGGSVNDLRGEVARAKAEADKAESARRQAEQQSADLQRRLQDCENRPAPATSRLCYMVLFDHDSHVFTGNEARKLRTFARTVRGQRLRVTAEATTPGSEAYNQRLSERRLRRVVSLLRAEGIDEADIIPQTAIGEQNGIATPEGRRVMIEVEK